MFSKLKRALRGPEAELLLADSSKSETQAPPSDAGKPIRLGLIFLTLGLGGFMLWASTAPIDEGVPAPGQVALDSKRKTVQHLTGGVVSEVLVQEGESVKEGQVLIKMRDAQSRANHEAALHSFYSLAAAKARLTAEQKNLPQIVFGPELANSQHPLAMQHRMAQSQLFAARRSALASDLAVMMESAQSAANTAASIESQLALMTDQLKGIRDLAAEGYVPRNQQLDMERQFVELRSNSMRARSQAAEMRLRATQRTQEFRREVETQLAEVTREVAVADQRLQAAVEELDRTVVKSPAEGQVVGLLTQMSGAVVTPGQRLMEVVPRDEALVLEVHIAPHLIDSIKLGLEADINFHTFSSQPDLRITGTVISVAGDLLTEQGPGGSSPYYLARVTVTTDGLKKLGSNKLQPGMPADVVIKTGERTFLAYVMKPLLRRLHNSLTES